MLCTGSEVLPEDGLLRVQFTRTRPAAPPDFLRQPGTRLASARREGENSLVRTDDGGHRGGKHRKDGRLALRCWPRLPRCGEGGSGRPNAFVHCGLWARARGGDHPGRVTAFVWQVLSDWLGPVQPVSRVYRWREAAVASQDLTQPPRGFRLGPELYRCQHEFLPTAWGGLHVGELTAALE